MMPSGPPPPIRFQRPRKFRNESLGVSNMSPPSDEKSLIFSDSPEVAVNLQKSLPHSLEAERAVLGAILLENSVFDQAAEILTESDFYLGDTRRFSPRWRPWHPSQKPWTCSPCGGSGEG